MEIMFHVLPTRTSLRGGRTWRAYIEAESSEFKSQGLYVGSARCFALLGPKAYIGSIFPGPTGYVAGQRLYGGREPGIFPNLKAYIGREGSGC